MDIMFNNIIPITSKWKDKINGQIIMEKIWLPNKDGICPLCHTTMKYIKTKRVWHIWECSNGHRKIIHK